MAKVDELRLELNEVQRERDELKAELGTTKDSLERVELELRTAKETVAANNKPKLSDLLLEYHYYLFYVVSHYALPPGSKTKTEVLNHLHKLREVLGEEKATALDTAILKGKYEPVKP